MEVGRLREILIFLIDYCTKINLMKLIALIFVFFLIFSCKQGDNNHEIRSINQPIRAISELKSRIVNKGDSLAYYELYYEFVDHDSQYDEFLFYSYIMAFKYNYPKAYLDVFYILCKMYNVNVEDASINLTAMDYMTKHLAVECIKRASELKYLDADKIYKSIRW